MLASVAGVERMVSHVIAQARRPARETGAVADAAAVVRDRVEFWSVLAEEQERPVRQELPDEPVSVPVSADDLAAAVDALLGNVFAHTPVGTGFAVAVRPGPVPAVVVEDSGAGIEDPALLDRGRSGGSSTGLGPRHRPADSGGGGGPARPVRRAAVRAACGGLARPPASVIAALPAAGPRLSPSEPWPPEPWSSPPRSSAPPRPEPPRRPPLSSPGSGARLARSLSSTPVCRACGLTLGDPTPGLRLVPLRLALGDPPAGLGLVPCALRPRPPGREPRPRAARSRPWRPPPSSPRPSFAASLAAAARFAAACRSASASCRAASPSAARPRASASRLVCEGAGQRRLRRRRRGAAGRLRDADADAETADDRCRRGGHRPRLHVPHISVLLDRCPADGDHSRSDEDNAAPAEPQQRDKPGRLAGVGCVFCKIVAGTAPASIAYADSTTVAFLDINPMTPGHLLVVPRVHAESLAELDAEAGAQLWRVGPAAGRGAAAVADPHRRGQLLPRRRGRGRAGDLARPPARDPALEGATG
jgi:hypothetical protein